MSLSRSGLLLACTVGLSAVAHGRPSLEPERLASRLARKDPAATHALTRLGPRDMRPLRRGILTLTDSSARERALAAWDTRVERLARAVLPERQAGKVLHWTLAGRSDLVPLVRCYRAKGQYAQAAIVDVEQQQELRDIDAETLTGLLARNSTRCRSPDVAREVARFFVALRHQPYAAEALKLKVRRLGRRGFRIDARYRRTLPWSSESGTGEDRKRTETRAMRLVLDRRGCRLRVVRDRVTGVVYSAP